MHLLDGPNTVLALPDPLPVGTPGYAPNDVGAGPGTPLTPDWVNAVTAELRAVIEAAGLALDKTRQDQLLAATRALGRNLQVFAAPGTFAFVVPAGVCRIFVEVYGGGGGGGGSISVAYSANAGSGGGYAYKACTVTPGDTIPVTVGIAGVAGTPGGGWGGHGGSSSFGTFCSASGGGGGQTGTAIGMAAPVGTPGSGIGGDLNLDGTHGMYGKNFSGGGGSEGPPGFSRGGRVVGGRAADVGGGAGHAGDPGLVLVWW